MVWPSLCIGTFVCVRLYFSNNNVLMKQHALIQRFNVFSGAGHLGVGNPINAIPKKFG